MDDYYDRPPRNPVAYGLLSLVCGIFGVVAYYSFNVPMAATCLGAIGMVIGGFSINVASHFPLSDKNRPQYMGFAATGLMASVIAFMLGFVNMF
ncbi:MAG: hypothetical protein FWH45_00550 [Methanomassiliicoccaceae archaeon]|nr:hypothetical protein [Methanomassiliicoccaceae archaeon]MCL2145660.1 hypothetical protein [Methanomassiliicoccaceae archaeon]